VSNTQWETLSVQAFAIVAVVYFLAFLAHLVEWSALRRTDQPGMELGKQFTYAMLGRPDAEQARQEWNMLPKPDSRFSV